MQVHFIAIGGSAMHNLAIALSKKGFTVSGSDDAIYEPSRTRLTKQGIMPEQEGWFPEKVHEKLDAVILGMHAREDNPELQKARELGLRIYSYPEYIYEQSKNKHRIVVGGSHGKTTITSMILHVLHHAGLDVDYLVGAQLEGFETMVRLTDTAPVIVIEGDEYLASPIDRRPKFHLYHGHTGIISGIAWDHINVFPTFENYCEQFSRFLETMEPGGTIIYAADDPEVKKVVEASKAELKRVPYHLPEHRIENGLTYLKSGEQEIPLRIFGKHNLSNLMAAKAACAAAGVTEEKFFQAIQSFKGAAKRLELLGENAHTAVYKDFAHSPSKLSATVRAVKEQFPDRELVAVIELHTFSSLNPEFLQQYKGSLDLADVPVVFLDEKVFAQKRMDMLDQNVVKTSFGNDKLKIITQAEILKTFLSSINYKSKNLLLMSSGTLGGMNFDHVKNNAINY